jgi:hypothetical protein
LASTLRKSRRGGRLNEHHVAPGGRRCVPARLQDGPGGDRLKAAGIALQVRPIARLAQVQESGCARGEARGGRGLGQIAMPIVNQFVTAADLWSGLVEPDYHAHMADVASLRAALHVAISLFHMSDWVFHTHETQVRAAFTFVDAKSTFESPCAVKRRSLTL